MINKQSVQDTHPGVSEHKAYILKKKKKKSLYSLYICIGAKIHERGLLFLALILASQGLLVLAPLTRNNL